VNGAILGSLSEHFVFKVRSDGTVSSAENVFYTVNHKKVAVHL